MSEQTGISKTDAEGQGRAGTAQVKSVVKLLTVIESHDRAVNIQYSHNHFTEFTPEQVNRIVSNLIAQASEHLTARGKMLFSTIDADKTLIDIAKGSLYDEIVFDVAIYTANDLIYASMSFGKLADPNTVLRGGLEYVTGVLDHLSQNFANLTE
jgi:hypothetical protein